MFRSLAYLLLYFRGADDCTEGTFLFAVYSVADIVDRHSLSSECIAFGRTLGLWAVLQHTKLNLLCI